MWQQFLCGGGHRTKQSDREDNEDNDDNAESNCFDNRYLLVVVFSFVGFFFFFFICLLFVFQKLTSCNRWDVGSSNFSQFLTFPILGFFSSNQER